MEDIHSGGGIAAFLRRRPKRGLSRISTDTESQIAALREVWD
jgi:hypothetical protein